MSGLLRLAVFLLAITTFILVLSLRLEAQNEKPQTPARQASSRPATQEEEWPAMVTMGGIGLGTKKASSRRLSLSVEDAVKLATTFNSGLKVAYYNHLIEKTRVSESEARFEPQLTVGANSGTTEVIFPQIFPTGNINPDGSPEFFQTIVNDRTEVANWNVGVNGIFPTGATYQLQIATDYRDRAGGGLINPSFQTTTSATLTQPILRNAWLQYNYAAVRLARYAEAESRQRYRFDLLNMIASVYDAYWNYVFAIQDLQVKRRSYDVARKLLDINKVKVETGVFAPIEIASAEAGVASRVTDVLLAENTIRDNADTLRRFIMPFKTFDDWNVELLPLDAATNVTYVLPTLEECLTTALDERPDLTEARIELRRREINVAVADNETLPQLDLNGSVSWTGLSDQYDESFVESFGGEGAETWNVGFSLEVPLGNRAARSRLARSRLERDQSLMSYRDLQLSAVECVRKAYRDVLISEKTILSQKKTLELRREELRNEQIKLDNKVSTNFQVLEVESDLASEESRFIRALVSYRISLANLANSMGSSLAVLKWAQEP